MELILKYFPKLSEKQTEQFQQLDALYHDWNAKINVISRKDIDNLYEHHVLHSLGIAEFTRFKSGTEIMDLVCVGKTQLLPARSGICRDCRTTAFQRSKNTTFGEKHDRPDRSST